MTGNSHRDRIEAAVEAHRDIQRSLRRQMVERDAAYRNRDDRNRAHRRADENVHAGRRIMRRANETDPDGPEDPPAVVKPRDQRPSRWLT